MPLERLTYESRATGSTGSLLNLATILGESQRNNARDGLTGALAAHRERYIQVVEGAAPDLDRLLRRLETDPRHKEIRTLERVKVSERIFCQWTMASPKITPELSVVLDEIVLSSDPDRILTLFQAAVGP